MPALTILLKSELRAKAALKSSIMLKMPERLSKFLPKNSGTNIKHSTKPNWAPLLRSLLRQISDKHKKENPQCNSISKGYLPSPTIISDGRIDARKRKRRFTPTSKDWSSYSLEAFPRKYWSTLPKTFSRFNLIRKTFLSISLLFIKKIKLFILLSKEVSACIRWGTRIKLS